MDQRSALPLPGRNTGRYSGTRFVDSGECAAHTRVHGFVKQPYGRHCAQLSRVQKPSTPRLILDR